MTLEEIFGAELQGKGGIVNTSDALKEKKYVMIYFSAHWCPPCRGFTPVLAKKYSASASEQKIEVVFVLR